MHKKFRQKDGFTLIEVIMAIVIAGILATIAVRSTVSISESGKIEMTKTEMQDIEFAIVGNDALTTNNCRTDFGYVGDVGSLPPNLNALVTNPGGYSTWDGPYIQNRFVQTSNDYALDAWGNSYSYSGVDITSTGSGSQIVHKLGESTSDFLYNIVSGNVFDSDGTPPGTLYQDSVTVLLTYPNGSGGLLTKGITPDFGGYFLFDSIPIGNQDMQVVYEPTHDTLYRYITVTPKSTCYNTYLLSENYWYDTTSGSGSGSGGGTGLIYVGGTGTTSGGGCNDVLFDIQNTSSSTISLTSINISWDSPTCYYKKITIDGIVVFDNANPRNASDITVTFSSISIAPGEIISISSLEFKTNPTGGPSVDMSDTDFTITFSEGSVITFNSGEC